MWGARFIVMSRTTTARTAPGPWRELDVNCEDCSRATTASTLREPWLRGKRKRRAADEELPGWDTDYVGGEWHEMAVS